MCGSSYWLYAAKHPRMGRTVTVKISPICQSQSVAGLHVREMGKGRAYHCGAQSDIWDAIARHLAIQEPMFFAELVHVFEHHTCEYYKVGSVESYSHPYWPRKVVILHAYILNS